MHRKLSRDWAKKVTIKDVAEYAGVSMSSVSRVLRDYPGVHPDLRARIEQAIQELGYQSAAQRRRQAEATSRVFYFLLTNRNLHIPFHSRVLQAIEHECSRGGDLLLYRTFQYAAETPPQELPLEQILNLRLETKRGPWPDGVVLTGPTYPNLLAALRRLEIPFVYLANNYGGNEPVEDAVAFDGHQGAYEATRYLTDLGHRQILFIGDPSVSWYTGIYEGYLQAVCEAGLKPLAQTKTLSDSYYSNGYLSVELALEQSPDLSAVFAGYDEIALGAWKALDDRNLSVPRDVSLIGFDDEDYAAFTVPPLTTVRIDVEALGRELIQQLYRKLREPAGPLPVSRLGTTLVKRGTCRPPKSAPVLAAARD